MGNKERFLIGRDNQVKYFSRMAKKTPAPSASRYVSYKLLHDIRNDIPGKSAKF